MIIMFIFEYVHFGLAAAVVMRSLLWRCEGEIRRSVRV